MENLHCLLGIHLWQEFEKQCNKKISIGWCKTAALPYRTWYNKDNSYNHKSKLYMDLNNSSYKRVCINCDKTQVLSNSDLLWYTVID